MQREGGKGIVLGWGREAGREGGKEEGREGENDMCGG